MFLLEHGSGSRRALALALQCLILPDHVGVQQGLQACVPVAGSLGQDSFMLFTLMESKLNFIKTYIYIICVGKASRARALTYSLTLSRACADSL